MKDRFALIVTGVLSAFLAHQTLVNETKHPTFRLLFLILFVFFGIKETLALRLKLKKSTRISISLTVIAVCLFSAASIFNHSSLGQATLSFLSLGLMIDFIYLKSVVSKSEKI